ncbi:hypothetical protein I4U23_020163 [Adineta vaga]|nr:hypothetical protein I4U23_020163 [Adineta vaga]
MNRFIQTYHNGRQPSYHQEYINHPLLPFKIALEPLLFKVDQLYYYMKLAEIKRNYSSRHNLTDDESAALYLYTSEWGPQSLNYLLNHAITSNDFQTIEPWFGFLKLLNNALEKLPSVKIQIWRAIRIDVFAQLRRNEIITWWNISSCSFSNDFIRSLLNNHLVLCSIQVLNGKSVRDFTPNTNEDEVLLTAGTRLLVKEKRFERYTNQYIVYFEEIYLDTSKTAATIEKCSSPLKQLSNNNLDSNGFKDNIVMSTITFSNGDRYEVTYRNGKKEGYGRYTSTHGKVYEGYEASNMAKGRGTCICTNGDCYDGTFEYGKMVGHGSYRRADRYTYVGNWISGEPFGKGKTIWPNGNCYEGFHENERMNGYGKFSNLAGDEYMGGLVDGKAHGSGKRKWKNGDYYDGKFQNDKKHGYGTYTYESGNKYSGDWSNDEMNGEGAFIWTSGSRYIGNFKNGKRHGYGRLTFVNGQVRTGYWENDKYIGEKR